MKNIPCQQTCGHKVHSEAEQLYEKTDKVTVLRGKYHQYLGMNLDFRTDGVVRVDMKDYVRETYKIFPDDLGGKVTSLAAEHIVEVRTDATKLDDS